MSGGLAAGLRKGATRGEKRRARRQVERGRQRVLEYLKRVGVVTTIVRQGRHLAFGRADCIASH